MSGIAGIVRFAGPPVDPGLIGEMTGAIAFRGPDGIEHATMDKAHFGHCRFCTTPQSLNEVQPLTNETKKLLITMDGRIDNRADLIADLHHSHSVSVETGDAKLVLCAYERWGQECLARFSGDFAFAIWDRDKQSLFCARDHNGNKPFVYHFDGLTLTFASEANAILRMPWVRKSLNEGLLSEFLANRWYARTDTVWKDIHRLPPAHLLKLSESGALAIQRYWEPDLNLPLHYKSQVDLEEQYRSLIFGVTNRMSRSHAPIGFEVSGGLDSSSLFCVADALDKTGDYSAPGLNGYTLDFAGVPRSDELEYVQAVAEKTRREIPAIKPTVKDEDWYRMVAGEMCEFPSYPNGIMSIGLRDEAKKDGCKVIMTGVGGDEWVGNFLPGAYYRDDIRAANFTNLLNNLTYDRSQMGNLSALAFFARHALIPLAPQFAKDLLRRLKPQHDPDWLSGRFHRIYNSRKSNVAIDRPCRPSQALQFTVLNQAYDSMARDMEERQAARLGIEIRSPFMSKDFIQFAFSAEAWMLRRGEDNRWLHCQSLGDIVPQHVIDRKSKADFKSVYDFHFEWALEILESRVVERRQAWISAPKYEAIIEAYRRSEGEGADGWILWSLLGCDLLASQTSL